MNKMIKAAGAAGTAGVLLVGGAGSLAYWNDSGIVPGTGISTGELKLTAVDSAAPCTGWKLDGGAALTAQTLLVPGDTLSNTCTYTITATGDHLSATIGVTGGDSTLESPFVTTTSSYTVSDGVNTSSPEAITDAHDEQTLEVTLKATFNGESSGNDTQGLTDTLADYKVTLTQTHDAT